jgi:Protein of unknown function (DUF1236)
MNSQVLSRPTAIILASMALVLMAAGVEPAAAQSSSVDEVVNPNGVAQTLELTSAQRSSIYQQISKDKSKVAPSRFPAEVAAEVPPMIELYTLPDDILATNPVTKLYKYTMVQDQVVIVDPTSMRTIAVIGPKR